jgi:hypothetical protein
MAAIFSTKEGGSALPEEDNHLYVFLSRRPPVELLSMGSWSCYLMFTLRLAPLREEVGTSLAAVRAAIVWMGCIRFVGERAFEDCFIDMVNQVPVVKKGISIADRVVKFVAGYIKFLNAKGAC